MDQLNLITDVLLLTVRQHFRGRPAPEAVQAIMEGIVLDLEALQKLLAEDGAATPAPEAEPDGDNVIWLEDRLAGNKARSAS